MNADPRVAFIERIHASALEYRPGESLDQIERHVGAMTRLAFPDVAGAVEAVKQGGEFLADAKRIKEESAALLGKIAIEIAEDLTSNPPEPSAELVAEIIAEAATVRPEAVGEIAEILAGDDEGEGQGDGEFADAAENAPAEQSFVGGYGWTDAQVAELKRLKLVECLTDRQIGERFGKKVGAVSQKIANLKKMGLWPKAGQMPAETVEPGAEEHRPSAPAARPPAPRPWQIAGRAAEAPKPVSRTAQMLADAARAMNGGAPAGQTVERLREEIAAAPPAPLGPQPVKRVPGTRWNLDEDGHLRRMRLAEKKDWSAIADFIGRSPIECQQRAEDLKRTGRWFIDKTDMVLTRPIGSGSSLGGAI